MQAGQQRWRDHLLVGQAQALDQISKTPGQNVTQQKGGDVFPLNNPNNEKQP